MGSFKRRGHFKGKRCLDEYIIVGVPTTASILSEVLSTKEFRESKIHVKFLEENFQIKEIEEEEVITDRPQKVTLDDSANPSLAPQRQRKLEWI